MTIDLQAIIATAIAFLLYCGVLAGGVQLAINQIKPLFLDPIKAWLAKVDKTTADQRYLIVIYVFRTVITTLAYLYLWGGVVATRAVIGSLAASVPDVGIAVVTIAFVVLGEEVLHPLVERLYILRDAFGGLATITVDQPDTPTLDKAA